ncbi:hypothetical protein J3R82DRAFT_9790 [Butyriboletus roseoflavus]|nr:hypothetical protein J3R82DRAFT_9790 [Butyriboletus roseoflavus]
MASRNNRSEDDWILHFLMLLIYQNRMLLGYVFHDERLNQGIEDVHEDDEEERRKSTLHPYYYELTHPSYPDHVFNPPLEPSFPPSLDTPSSRVPTTSHPLTFVSTAKALLSMANTISSVTELAVDLEHHSYRSHRGFLALMQISTRQGDFVVDILVPEVREGLRQAKGKSVGKSEEARMASEAGEIIARVFADPSVIKVFHGAESDIVWLQQDFNIFVVGLFDTFHAVETACLAYLLETYCDFVPDKRYQLADWRIRPLPTEMLTYARSDTHFLLYIYDMLRLLLVERSSATPVIPGETRPLTNTKQTHHGRALIHGVLTRSSRTALRLYEIEVYDAEGGTGSNGWDTLARKWNKLGLVGSPSQMEVQGSQAAVYKAVHRWRENMAREEDESTRYVLPTHHLFLSVERMPTTIPDLLSLFGGPGGVNGGVPPVLKRRTGELVTVIKGAMEATKSMSSPQGSTEDRCEGAKMVVSAAVEESEAISFTATSSSTAKPTNESRLWALAPSSTSATTPSISRSSLFGIGISGERAQEKGTTTASSSSTTKSTFTHAQVSDDSAEHFRTLMEKIHKTLVIAPVVSMPSFAPSVQLTNRSFASMQTQALETSLPGVPVNVGVDQSNSAAPGTSDHILPGLEGQVEIPFVPAHKRQTFSNPKNYEIKDDTIVVVGQAGARQRKRKRDKVRGISPTPKLKSGTRLGDAETSASICDHNREEEQFDYSSVPNLLDNESKRGDVQGVHEENERRTKKQRHGKATNALIQQDLNATDIQISWTLAAFIIVQGTFPLAWSAASEIKGRKVRYPSKWFSSGLRIEQLVYIAATTIFVLACAILANARTINVLIGMRVVQAAGSSAAIAISAATLADIYETHERGTMMGIFYAAPLLGPALGPILGGCLSQAFGWPAGFYFLAACGGVILGAFIFLFKDTFRFERSLTYQAALRRRTITAGNLKSTTDSTIAESKGETEEKQAEVKKVSPQPSSIEDGTAIIKVESGLDDVRLSFSDINPFPPLWKIIQRKNNVAILLANGLVFAFSYSLSYTCTRTLSTYYGYDANSVGLVLLSLGAGSVGGSVIGGRWSDHVVTKMKTENEGNWYPEVDALEECDTHNGLATRERHWVRMGGREARSRGRDLPNAVLVRILFDRNRDTISTSSVTFNSARGKSPSETQLFALLSLHATMGQSLSRRPAPPPSTTSASVPTPGDANNTHTARRSLPHRIFSSLPKPLLRSRLFSSLTLPTRPEQTLRGKKRRWWLSRRHDVPASTEGAVSECMNPLTEHDEHQVDRDVDEFGVITHRVPDSHRESPAASAKGKEKAKDIISDIEDDNEDNDETPIPSSSTALPRTQSGAGKDHADGDQVVIAPTVPPPPFPPPTQEPERSFVPLPSAPTPPPPPQSSTQQANTSPRPFPPPGTLVVVQGVVHTTDVPRSSERPAPTSNPTSPTTNDASSNTNTSFETSTTRPSPVPPGTSSRNPLSGILPRPASMIPAVPSSPHPESMVGSSNTDSQGRQVTPNASGAAEDSEEEDRTHPHSHGISMTQGPVGASGLSASSIDVLGTLLSVAAAATAASLLTGSSEPIFSSGLTSSQPPPSSNTIPQPMGLNSNVPSERPLSPTPTSDAGRMRHVWSNLRDRLGVGSGARNSNHSNDTTSTSGPGQSVPSQLSEVVRPRDPREIMLAEMARAFNLGLGLGGTAANTPSAATSASSNTPELAMSDDADVPAGDRDGQPPTLPPPDSFERFLMDLQTDLRVTLMQEQEPGVPGGAPRDADQTAEDVEEDQPIPELQSLSDSDSEEFETRHSNGDDEDEPDCEEDVDEEGDEEDVHTAQEQLSGRASPALSALGSGIHSPFDVRTRPGSSSSFRASGMPPPHTTLSQSTSTAIFLGTNSDIGATNSTPDINKNGDVDVAHASSSAAIGMGTHVLVDDLSPSDMRSEEELEGLGERAVLGVAHSLGGSAAGQRVESDTGRTILGAAAVSPLDAQDPSNVPVTGTAFLLGTSSLSGPSTTNTPISLPGGPASTTQVPPQSSTSTLPPSSDPEATTQNSSSTNSIPEDSSMPFRFPFTPSSASRTEHTPGGGINWWRMYRFPAIASPNLGQQGGPQGSSPLSQSAFRTPTQGPSHTSTSPWTSTTDQNQQNEVITPRGMAQIPGIHSGLAQPALTPSAATSTNMPEMVSTTNQSTSTPPFPNSQDSNPPTNTNTSTNPPEHRSNVVVPVIVVGLQSVNVDRQPPHMPPPHANHAPAIDDEDGEGMDLDGLEQPMSMPLHIPEPAEFRHHTNPSNTTQQEQGGQQPARGRTWHSRAANAIRNLRPSRRNTDATSPQPQETPGSRTFLIYVIGGYYPPDHQIITGGNLDSFEALWELAELLGQVKPPTVSKEDIDKSGLEIMQASMLAEYEKQGRVASNCIDRCLICLDDYNPQDELRVLTCKHTFHQGCVDRWLETGRNNCPACRTKGVGNENAGPSSATSPDRLLQDI